MVRPLAVTAGLLGALAANLLGTAPGAAATLFRIEARTTEPLLVSDRPQEDFQVNYVNVIRDGQTWHMWYEAYPHTYQSDADGYLCYARSVDGVKWEKPNLGLVEYAGSRANNIVLAGPPLHGVTGHCVFLDPAAPAAERFKVVFSCFTPAPGTPWGSQWQVYGGTSPDGLHWQLIKRPLLACNSDTQTVCFRDGDLYRMYVRVWSQGDGQGRRQVGYTESRTFGNFPAPVVVLAPDETDPRSLHYYNSAAVKLQDSLYVTFPSVYDAQTGIVIPHLAVSRDGRQWSPVSEVPGLSLGRGFDGKSIYVGPGAVPGDRPGSWWVYYSGYRTGHDDAFKSKVQHLGGVGRFLLVLKDPAVTP